VNGRLSRLGRGHCQGKPCPLPRPVCPRLLTSDRPQKMRLKAYVGLCPSSGIMEGVSTPHAGHRKASTHRDHVENPSRCCDAFTACNTSQFTRTVMEYACGGSSRRRMQLESLWSKSVRRGAGCIARKQGLDSQNRSVNPMQLLRKVQIDVS
jgi:hypothetical protein